MSGSPKIKVCGIRRDKDVEYINDLLPEYAGFVFAESKRKVSLDEFNILIKNLKQCIIPVGVYVNHNMDEVVKSVKLGIKVVQLHGDENAEYISGLRRKLENFNVEIWKAIRVKQDLKDSFKDINISDVDRVLFDKYKKNAYGGTGETFQWDLIKKFYCHKSYVLAGGLDIDNIEEALGQLEPYCVDVSTGVEKEGYKSYDLIKAFIEKVRGERK